MNDQRAQELRTLFDRLKDSDELTLLEVEMVPAVLGRAVSWSYSTTNGELTRIVAYDTQIATAGDLRQLLEAHPRNSDNDEELGGVDNAIVATVRTLMERAITPLRQTAAMNRVRLRALVEILSEADPAFYRRLADRIRDVAERDLVAFEAALTLTPAEGAERLKDWRAQDEADRVARMGAAAAAEDDEAWRLLLERLDVQVADMFAKNQDGGPSGPSSGATA